MNLMLDTPRFLFSDLSAAIGVDQNNLKGWLNRGAASLDACDRPAGGSGKRTLVTLRTVYKFAITARLVGIGVPPALAFMCASIFSRPPSENNIVPKDDKGDPLPFFDTGEDQTDYRNDDTLLFDRGNTVFIIWHNDRMIEFDAEGSGSIAFNIVNIDENCDKRILFEILFPDNLCAANVLYCNPILDAVDKALGVRRG